MKKTAIAAFIVALAPVASHADLLFTVGAKASVWNAEPTGQIDDDISVDSSNNGLGLDSENGTQLTVFFEHPVPMLPNIKLKQTSLDLSGDGTLALSTSFNGQAFAGPITSDLDLSHTDVTLYWGLPLPLPYVDINFGATARMFDGSAEVKNAGATESVDLNATVPMVYGAVKVDTPFGVYAQVDVNYIGYSGNTLSDISYGLGYDLPVPIADIGLEAGYRSLSMKTDEDLTDIATDVDVSGLYYGASVSIGF
jgi:outer membrane protein